MASPSPSRPRRRLAPGDSHGLRAVAISFCASCGLRLFFAVADELTLFVLDRSGPAVRCCAASATRLVPRSRFGRLLALVLLVPALFYFLPNTVEWILLRVSRIPLSVLLFGDLTGCLFLALGLGLRRTASFLYVSATLFEAILLLSNLLSLGRLIWVTDLVPTLTILCLLGLPRG